MTQEEYYWYIKRPHDLRTQRYLSRGVGCGPDKHESQTKEFLESLKKERSVVENGEEVSYFWSATMTDYYWEDMVGRNPMPPMTYSDFGCTGLRKGNFHGRNYDYYYDKTPQIVLRIPENESHYGSIQIVQYPVIKEKDLQNRTQTLMDCIRRVPFVVVDGMNQYGLVAQQNMLPVGDNPYFNMEFNEKVDGEFRLHENWNRTYHTNRGKPRRCVTLLMRTVLDKCKSVREAVDLIGSQFDWYSYFSLDGTDFKTSGLELHYMLSDKNQSAIVEFANRDYATKGMDSESDIYVTWFENDTKVKSTRIRNGEETVVEGAVEQKPIMTNFYVSRWNGDCSNFKTMPISNDTLTRYAIGLERYSVLDENYDGVENAEDMLEVMKKVEYDNAYSISGEYHTHPYSKYWNSEFCDPLNSTLSDAQGEFKGVYFGMQPSEMSSVAKRDCDKYQECWKSKTRLESSDPDCPWITINRSVYDMDNLTLSVVVQQDDVVHGYSLWEE